MKARKVLPALTLAGTVALFSAGAIAHGTGHWHDGMDNEEVATEVKEVSDGVQITITSEDKETAQRLKENAPWYKRFLRGGCGHRDEDGHGHGGRGRHHGHW